MSESYHEEMKRTCGEYRGLNDLSDLEILRLAAQGQDTLSEGTLVSPLVYRLLGQRGLLHELHGTWEVGFDHHNPEGNKD